MIDFYHYMALKVKEMRNHDPQEFQRVESTCNYSLFWWRIQKLSAIHHTIGRTCRPPEKLKNFLLSKSSSEFVLGQVEL